MASVKITHLGHASFRIESPKGTVIYFDPWLDENPTANLQVANIRKADIVMTTHGHVDHLGDSFKICQSTGAKFIGGYELCLIAETHGLTMGELALPMNPGGSLKVADATITMTQTQHSMSISSHVIKAPLPEGLVFHPDGTVGGFVIAFEDGITIYDSSDTCLFSDMQLIGQMYTPQIAILPVGGLYTMGVREAARAASFIRPDLVIPCHYGDTVGQPADIEQLREQVRFLAPNTKVVELGTDRSVTYSPSSYELDR